MKRAEWFVMRGQGHWAKCRKAFLCEFAGPFGPCLNPVSPGDTYLATKLPRHPHLPAWNPLSHATKRYCAYCAIGELTDQHVVDKL